MATHVLPNLSGEWAAPRDASVFDRPDVRKPKVAHVSNGHGEARCSGVNLAEDMRASLDRVSELSRCRRPACRKRWPAPTTTEGDQTP